MDIFPRFFTEMVDQDLHRDSGGVPDCLNSQSAESLTGSAAAAIEFSDRQRPHLLLYFLRKKGVGFVRFCKIACHFGQQAVGRDTDIHRKSEFPEYPLPDLPCQFHSQQSETLLPAFSRRSVAAPYRAAALSGSLRHRAPALSGSLRHSTPAFSGNPRHSTPALYGIVPAAFQPLPAQIRGIHVSLINRSLFNQRRVLPQDFQKTAGILPVGLEVGGDDDQARTLLHGGSNSLRGADPILFGRQGLGCHNPVPLGTVSSHNRRDRPQIHASRLVAQLPDRGPGQKSRVHIYMKNDFFFCLYASLFFHFSRISTCSINYESSKLHSKII